MNNQFFSVVGIVLIVVRNKKGQYLAVLETKNRGWWLPGGRVEQGETFEQAAIRETLEEAAINVQLKGVLRAEYDIDNNSNFLRFKIVYYAEPINEQQLPKSKPDNESLLAQWVDFQKLEEFNKNGPNWRGPELLIWSQYIENNGIILPLSVISQEGSKIQMAKAFTIDQLN